MKISCEIHLNVNIMCEKHIEECTVRYEFIASC